MRAFRSLLAYALCSVAAVHAVTVYNQLPLAAQSTSTPSASDTAAAAAPSATGNYTGLAAYDPTTWPPPAIPNPAPATQFGINVMPTADQVTGLSINTPSSFYGISIEMSVVTQVLGINASFINVPFLNLMSLLAERAGQVVIRVGGNTQDYATLVPSTQDGKMIEKQSIDPNNPTGTPTIIFTDEMLYMLSNISTFVNIKWFLGVPFNDTVNIHMEIVEQGERIIGDNLLGFQVGNEPDLYLQHQHRLPGYDFNSYYTEFGQWRDAFNNDANVPQKKTMIGPSLALANPESWTLEDTWNTGFLPNYVDSLYALSVERYPDDNCAAIYAGFGPVTYPPSVFPNYLSHASGRSICAALLNSTLVAQTYSLPFIMFETNSASCGGFAGISNVFGITLWALDYGLQMVYSNLTHALIHVGGQDVYYNPFTPPPTNQSTYHQWTIGPIFYSILAMPEILGNSNTSRVVDLFANSNNDLTPAYAIYENDQLARVALFNYMDDGSDAMALNVAIQVGGGNGQPASTPAQVKVKYLVAPSVSEKFNITWGGQTFGGEFESDGRLMGQETIQTVPCDTTAGTCTINVPAPGFALVYVSDTAVQDSEPAATATFSTTALTKTVNTATIDQSVLATSNGHSGKDRFTGSTSKGSSGASRAAGVIPSLTAVFAVLATVGIFFKAFTS
ncbi:glycoside hydrolase family 79 protein [Phanerochaete sordida]|uniref:Glycoside hydrolase family 79 protein n=1 Tax=Phanerochaete sordida TaxID=48140 RepID=A0A9P3G6A4_9APHY|nr:glycoside hydrolase family 79 protein [Phanerochaete sordida]